MQCGENQMPRFRRRHRDLNSFKIAHFTDQDHIRSLAHRRAQCLAVIRRININLPLAYNTLLMFMQKLNRIFKCQYMAIPCTVDLVDNIRKGGTLPAARRPCHKNNPFLLAAHAYHRFRYPHRCHIRQLESHTP